MVLATTGLGGGAGVGQSNAFNGTTVAEMYDPSQPVGQRWSTVADSRVWRMYHSIAFLTPNAEVRGVRPAACKYQRSYKSYVAPPVSPQS